MTALSPLDRTTHLFHRMARTMPPAVERPLGTVARILIRLAVLAPLLVGAFALRWAFLVFQP